MEGKFLKVQVITENLLRSSQNIIVMLKTMTFVANVILHLMEMKQEVFTQCVNLQSSFIDLCDSCDEDGTVAISFCPFESSL